MEAVLDDNRAKAVDLIQEKFRAVGEEFPVPYVSMWKGLEVDWVEVNRPFCIAEYDGYESVCYQDRTRWRTLRDRGGDGKEDEAEK